MTPPEDLLDQRLREALSPPPEQAERIVRRALAAPQAGDTAGDGSRFRPPRLRRLVPAAALVALLTAAAVFFSLQLERTRQSAVVSIVNIDGMVIATSEEEERPLVLSGTGELQSSGIILVRHGDPE
jgi:hypothetical protein